MRGCHFQFHAYLKGQREVNLNQRPFAIVTRTLLTHQLADFEYSERIVGHTDVI